MESKDLRTIIDNSKYTPIVVNVTNPTPATGLKRLLRIPFKCALLAAQFSDLAGTGTNPVTIIKVDLSTADLAAGRQENLPPLKPITYTSTSLLTAYGVTPTDTASSILLTATEQNAAGECTNFLPGANATVYAAATNGLEILDKDQIIAVSFPNNTSASLENVRIWLAPLANDVTY